MSAELTPRAFDEVRSRTRKYPCGMCGQLLKMSRSHVPPRGSGNEGIVHRTRLIIRGNDVMQGRPDRGGIHFFGLCRECNTAAGAYDPSYSEFSNALRPWWIRDWSLDLPASIPTPQMEFRPGEVVRSLLFGMMATTPIFRQQWPTLAEQLMPGDPVELPSGMRLRLAFARGRSARVSGTMSGYHLVGRLSRHDADGRPVGIHSLSSVYFPPLAWELVHSGPTLLDEYGWADVSDWTQIAAGEERCFSDLVEALPLTAHPWHHPDLNRHWAELASSTLSQVIECQNIEGGSSRTIGAPLTLEHRAYLPMKEIEQIMRSRVQS